MLLLVGFLITLASELKALLLVGLHQASSPATLVILCMDLRAHLGGWMRIENPSHD